MNSCTVCKGTGYVDDPVDAVCIQCQGTGKEKPE